MKSRVRRVGRARRVITTARAPAPGGHYSQAIADGRQIYVSGSGPFDPKTHRLVGKDIETQTKQTLENIRAILEAAGASLEDIAKITVYLRDMGHFDRMDRVYKSFFPQDPPARTTIEVGLYGADRLIAMDAVAVKKRG